MARKTGRKPTRVKAMKPASRLRVTGARRAKSTGARAKLDFKLLGCSNEAVQRATGRGWAQWLRVLDRFDVRVHGHKQAAAHLHDRHRCPGWWSQMVVVGYERLRGLRRVRETATGFSASASRVIAASAERILDAFEDPKLACRWLPKGVRVHRVSRPKGARMTWTDGRKCISVSLVQKRDKSGAIKTGVAVQHEALADAAGCQRIRALWKSHIERLRSLVES